MYASDEFVPRHFPPKIALNNDYSSSHFINISKKNSSPKKDLLVLVKENFVNIKLNVQ